MLLSASSSVSKMDPLATLLRKGRTALNLALGLAKQLQVARSQAVRRGRDVVDPHVAVVVAVILSGHREVPSFAVQSGIEQKVALVTGQFRLLKH